MQKICEYCKSTFDTSHRIQRYCSKPCAGNGAAYFSVKEFAGQSGRALRGRAHTPEHVANRIASIKRTLAGTTRTCVECGDPYTPTTAPQKYCSGRCYEVVRRRRTYNITTSAQRRAAHFRLLPEERAGLLELQGGVCAICGLDGGSRGLCVDHCHETGIVRGLLCHGCNTAIGLAKESPDRLRAAADYLERHQV